MSIILDKVSCLYSKGTTYETYGIRDISLKIEDGEFIGLIGHTGSGKSTLIQHMNGLIQPTSGAIYYNGQDISDKDYNKKELRSKVGLVFQYPEYQLFETSVLKDVCFGPKNQGLSEKDAQLRAYQALKSVGIAENLFYQSPFELSGGQKRRVAIAGVLAMNPEMLILDEPTAALNDEESKQLLEIMLELKKQGITCIIISHKLNEISYVSDSITVIRDGKTIETLEKGKDEFTEDRIIKGMVGRELTNRYPIREGVTIGDTIFEVKNWNVFHPDDANRQIISDVNFHVKAGEVVGFAGLMGAGRTELAMSIFGRSGEIKINGKEVHLKTVKDAIDNKLAYVSEDRKQYGLVLIDSIKGNMTMAALRNFFSKNGIVNENDEIVSAEEYKKKINVKANSIDQPVGSLSGGNQQKVVLAKWMLTQPDVLILDEPTRGIDVGAKYEIYQVINDLAKAGKAVIVISSEMPEVIGTCDRVYVINEGKIAGELDKSELSQEGIMQCIMAHNRKDE